jgi:hypothetical protein
MSEQQNKRQVPAEAQGMFILPLPLFPSFTLEVQRANLQQSKRLTSSTLMEIKSRRMTMDKISLD